MDTQTEVLLTHLPITDSEYARFQSFVREGDHAGEVIPIIARRFQNQGLGSEEFHVKRFGGSNMFPDLSLDEVLSVGSKNIYRGERLLGECGFKVAKTDLAGISQRMVIFNSGAGTRGCARDRNAPPARKALAGLLGKARDILVMGQGMDPVFARVGMGKQWPDLILLDVEMPRTDGNTFLRKLMADLQKTPGLIAT